MESITMGSLKKRLCNPPAEELAASGDPLVLGHFRAAGGSIDEMPAAVQEWFGHEASALEMAYIKGRTELCADIAAKFQALAYEAVKRSSAAKGNGADGR